MFDVGRLMKRVEESANQVSLLRQHIRDAVVSQQHSHSHDTRHFFLLVQSIYNSSAEERVRTHYARLDHYVYKSIIVHGTHTLFIILYSEYHTILIENIRNFYRYCGSRKVPYILDHGGARGYVRTHVAVMGRCVRPQYTESIQRNLPYTSVR